MATPNQPDPSLVIFQTTNIDRKIYVKEQSGKFQKIRRFLGWTLMIFFITLQFIQFNGHQAILFDVAAQTLTLFSLTLYPQDLMIFVYVFIFAAFLLFYVSTKFGRIWCGFTCPQTIWSFLFMWVENRFEGNMQQRKQLDNAPWSVSKLVKKSSKHFAWGIISVLTATAFMSYFVPATDIYKQLITFTMSGAITAWVGFFALCTYLNAGLVREKMCQHMCPYARFQSVMVNSQTKLITYDEKRGESRGPRKLKQAAPDHLGDCVDCKLCVQVCPVGIDIRDGLQFDCINCGLCIDACDQTMDKFNYDKGLIRFNAASKQVQSKVKDYSYILLMIFTLAASVVWLQQRDLFELTVIKDRNVLYRTNTQGLVENSFQLELLNKSNEEQVVFVQLKDLPDFTISPAHAIVLKPNEMHSKIVTVTAPETHETRFKEFEFALVNAGDTVFLKRQATFQQGSR